jgi:hypothetical protein
MDQRNFEAPLFERSLPLGDVVITTTPFFYNDAGKPRYVREDELPSGLIPLTPAKTDCSVAIGFECQYWNDRDTVHASLPIEAR